MKFGQHMSYYRIQNFNQKFYEKGDLETSSRPFFVYKELSAASTGK